MISLIPDQTNEDNVVYTEMIFLIDRSGSMEGTKIQAVVSTQSTGTVKHSTTHKKAAALALFLFLFLFFSFVAKPYQHTRTIIPLRDLFAFIPSHTLILTYSFICVVCLLCFSNA
eukprot:TRINITY_DN4932_c0_g1_i1.p1 TRINITY_DN4932_c0_g1~~TRINITY_DN4932_c0_g1_i1.p1  ORF type:complete len:115 (-),score=26.20 TRINITY_DN4932_c0_g1_i1:312-656(-)